MSSSLWSFGPIGYAQYLHVKEFPVEDAGCFCTGVQKALAWDCAIVAYLLAADFKCTLMGNNLGPSSDADIFRQMMKSRKVALREFGESAKDSFDVVIASSTSATRTWISNITPPSYESLIEQIRLCGQHNHPEIIYCDVWNAGSASEELSKLATAIDARLLFCNLGDNTNLGVVKTLSRCAKGPLLMQLSYKENGLVPLDFNDLDLGKDQVLVVTYGHRGAFIKTVNRSKSIGVEPVFGVSTVGAGAYLSVGVLKNLAMRHNYEPLTLMDSVSLALEEVQKMIRTEQFTQHLF
jgi:hypothetical protein